MVDLYVLFSEKPVHAIILGGVILVGASFCKKLGSIELEDRYKRGSRYFGVTLIVAALLSIWLGGVADIEESSGELVGAAEVTDDGSVAPPVEPPDDDVLPKLPPPSEPRSGAGRVKTLYEGEVLDLPEVGLLLSLDVDDEMATIRLQPDGGGVITEAVLGPGGSIPFQVGSTSHFLNIVDWDLEKKTMSITITSD